MDLSHWDLKKTFGFWEAACLASGIDPKVKTHQPELDAKATVISEALRNDYEEIKRENNYYLGWDKHAPDETEYSIFEQGTLPSVGQVELALRLRNSGTSYEMEEVCFEDSPVFTRNRLDEWFKHKNVKSVYNFVPITTESPPSVEKEKPSSKSDRENLLKQIAALSLAFAQKSEKYKKGNKPNASQIANSTIEVLDALPDANLRGVGNSSIRESIMSGLSLLTMTKK